VSFTDPLLSSEVDKEKAHQGGIVRTEHHGNLPTRGLPASKNSNEFPVVSQMLKDKECETENQAGQSTQWPSVHELGDVAWVLNITST
jgi:hypothetical protein